MINIRKLETELWEAADLLRADSKVTSQEYCMPVLGLIFLRYAYSRFKFVEADILKDRPMRNGRVLPVEPEDFKTKSAIFLPEKARYDYLLNLPDDEDMGQAINNAMGLIEGQSAQLKGILPKNYTILKNDLLRELLRIFNNSAFNEMKDDVIGRIYEYFLNKFAPAVASDDGVFFTPKSLVRMIVNIIEPSHGTILDPACGSGGMFVSSADFIEQYGVNANTAMTFYGQEKVDYNAKLCVMNGWNHNTVDSIVNLLSGYAFKSTTFDDSGDFKIVTIKNVQDGFFDGENVNRILEMPSKMPDHCVLQDGDILLSLTGNVGRVCLVNGENYLLNQRVAKLDSKFKGYTYCLFRSKDMFDAMNNLANGAAQQNLSPIRTGNIEIPIPNDTLLADFEKIINPIIKKILILNKEISELKQARDRLLPKLMSGEIEV